MVFVSGVLGGLGRPCADIACLSAFDIAGIGMGPRVGETGLSISSACSLRVVILCGLECSGHSHACVYSSPVAYIIGSLVMRKGRGLFMLTGVSG